MPVPTSSTKAVLMPLTVSHGTHSVDMAVPASVPMVEILPGMVQALGRLTAVNATQGFRVLRSSGKELEQSASLESQEVPAGSVLSLVEAGRGDTDIRYDDLVEAVGHTVETTRSAWNRGDSVALSAHAAVAMFVAAMLLLVLRGGGSVISAAVAGVGAILLTISAAVVARVPDSRGSAALALTTPVMTAAVGFCVWDGSLAARAMFAGIGLLVGSLAVFVLPSGRRSLSAGPVTGGAALVLLGLLVAVIGVDMNVGAATVVAVMTIVTLMAPWLGIVQLPRRIEALSGRDPERWDARTVSTQVVDSAEMVLAIRVAAGIVTVVLTAAVAVTVPGAVLMGCAGVAHIMQTRSMYGRAEVLTGVVTGIVTLLVAGWTVATALPETLGWLVAITSLVGAVILANNVISVKVRPGMTRVADAVHVLALMAVLPLTAVVWGVV